MTTDRPLYLRAGPKAERDTLLAAALDTIIKLADDRRVEIEQAAHHADADPGAESEEVCLS